MTNEELVARFQNGEDVFEELYNQNAGFIHKMAHDCSRKSLLEKDDLVSEFMYVLHKCAGSYNLDANNKFITFLGTSLIRSFVKATERSEYINVYSKTLSLNVPLKIHTNGTPPEIIELIPSHHEEFSYRTEVERVCHKILNQSFSARVAGMVMEYFSTDLTFRELGDKHGISHQAVALNVKRARNILKTELTKQDIA